MTPASDNPVDPASKAHQTVALIRNALAGGRSASIAQIVELIREVTCKFESISVQQLGDVIGRDLPTMSRVLSVAHTLGYNPEGVEITTINQAIHVIGFNKIRNLALSLMLMQNATAAGGGELREVAARALIGGLFAQSLRAREKSDDAEEAFVCAALRNYGRIMVASFLPDEFRVIANRPAGTTECDAFRQRLGIGPLELTLELLGQSRMPHNVMVGLREIGPAQRNAPASTREQELPIVATFADELCRLLDDPSLTIDNFTSRALNVARSFGSNVSLEENELFELLGEVSNTLNTFGALQNGNALNCPLLNRLRALARRSDVVPVTTCAIPPETTPAVSEESGRQRKYQDPLSAGIAALIELATQPAVTLDKLHSIALPAVHDGLGFSQTIVFRRIEGSPLFEAWRGTGDFFAMIRGEPLLDARVRDVFSVCLRRGEDVLIQNPGDPKIRPFIPEWLRPAAGSQAMILLPVQRDGSTIVVFCGLWNDRTSVVLAPRIAQQLRSLRHRISELEQSIPHPETADAPAAA